MQGSRPGFFARFARAHQIPLLDFSGIHGMLEEEKKKKEEVIIEPLQLHKPSNPSTNNPETRAVHSGRCPNWELTFHQAKGAKEDPKGAENKRGGAVVHIGKSGKRARSTALKLLAVLSATTKEKDAKPTQKQRQRSSLTHQEHDRAVDRDCKKPFLHRKMLVFEIQADQIIQSAVALGFTAQSSVEILTEIFWQCVMDEGWGDIDRNLDDGRGPRDRRTLRVPDQCRLSPWNFAQTCQRWRQITLSNSKLWSFISITSRMCHHWLDRDEIPSVLTSLEAATIFADKDANLALQIQRSGSFPLTLKIEGALTNVLSTAPGFQMLLASSIRWKHLKYGVNNESEAGLLTHMDMNLLGLPILESLHLSRWPSFSELVVPSQLLTPNLRYIDGVIPNEPHNLYPIDWGQITKFHDDISENMALLVDYIRIMPQIEELNLEFYSDARGWDWEASDPLLLPYLHTLSLTSYGFLNKDRANQGFETPIKLFIVPALKSLELVGDLDMESIRIEDLRLLLQRGRTSLKKLRLVSLTLPDLDLECMRLLGSLDTLELVDIRIDDAQKLMSQLIQGELSALRKLTLVSRHSIWPQLPSTDSISTLKMARPKIFIDTYWDFSQELRSAQLKLPLVEYPVKVDVERT
ncbi:hypothetical protein C8J56DRAFT_883240 [Mycena floridula]|nr:hypothetical protein C8J56DRAFT_883240 [Mycena floridula]